MEVNDGFIVGVFNYCDRWCERCALTSRCRVFADRAEYEFERDHGPIGEPRAERMAREIGAAMERWEKELGIDFGEIQREATELMKNEDARDEMFEVELEHLELETRASDFVDAVWKWLKPISQDQYGTSTPLQVLAHFWVFVGAKVHRALMGLKDDGLGDRSDALGSAKAALLGLDEMRAACRALSEADVMSPATKNDLVERIDWLVRRIESTLPAARAFIRPGLDELDEVAKLNAGEPA